MKIYNEIVIDMNPESSSYGKTLHEDSFDYKGDMMLMQNSQYDFNQDGVVDMLDINAAPVAKKQQIADIVSGGQGGGALGGGGASSDLQGQLAQTTQGMTYKYILKSYDNTTNTYKAKDLTGPGITHEKYYSLPKSQRTRTTDHGDESRYEQVKVYPVYEYKDNAWVNTGKYDNYGSNTATGANYTTYDDATQLPGGQFTYTKDEHGEAQFDPTSQEFQTSVEGTGGFDELITGFGLQGYESYFDPVNMDQLGFLGEQQDLSIKQGQIDTATMEETKRAETEALDIAGERNLGALQAAQAQYGRDRRGAGQAVGQSLYAASQQQQEQASRAGFAGGGGGTRAQRGIMADYNLQQEQLAAGLGGAKSAFDLTKRELTSAETGIKSAYDLTGRGITLGQQQAGLDYRSGVSQFWDAAQEDFYGQLTTVEGIKQG